MLELLQETCPFKVTESDPCANIFYESLNFTRIQYSKCPQLLSRTIQCMNKIPDNDNLIVKVTCYAKCGIPITGFVNVIFQLPMIVSHIRIKENFKTIFFTTLINECVGEKNYSYK